MTDNQLDNKTNSSGEQSFEQSSGNGEKLTGKRSPGLTLICLLTFLGSGLSAISFLIIYLIFNYIPGIVMDDKVFEQAQQMKIMIESAGRMFFLIMLFLYVGSLIGAVMMWKRRKTGFHFYTTTQLLMLLIPFFMLAGYTIPFANIAITGVFITAYGLNLKEMA